MNPGEVVKIAEMTLEVERAREAFVDAQNKQVARTGISALVGRIRLRRATRAAEEQGLIVLDGHVIVPIVVSSEDFDGIEDGDVFNAEVTSTPTNEGQGTLIDLGD